MGKVRIEFHDEGFRQVLKSPGVTAEVTRQARAVAARAGEGFEAEAGTGGQVRSRAFVRATTARAIRKNAKDATLLRALGR